MAKTTFKALLMLLAVWMMAACGKEDELLTRMREIKEVGNRDPLLAMQMLDSLKLEVEKESTYLVQTWRLLEIRLNDKADVTPTSDIAIRDLMEYFDKRGTDRERQEVHYYAGSVYRDLQDMPRALEQFLWAAEIADCGRDCDSLMLRNTYSNLHALYYSVQDYENALEMALKECEVADKLNVLDAITVNHAGISFYKLGREEESAAYCRKTLELVKENLTMAHPRTLSGLLFYFSRLNKEEEADECYALIRELGFPDGYAGLSRALGDYFLLKDNLDSAACYYERMLEADSDLQSQSDATKCLYLVYKEKGNDAMALRYADMHISVNNELDYGKRQEIAATTNNQYQYHRNQREEERIKARSENLKFWLTVVSLSSVVALAVLLASILYRRNRHLKEILRNHQRMQEQETIIAAKDQKLAEATAKIGEGEEELNRIKEEMSRKDNYYQLMGQTASDAALKKILQRTDRATNGAAKLTDEEWLELITWVNEKFPDFKQSLIDAEMTVKDDKTKAFYLMCLGYKNADITRITGISTSTVSRWRKNTDITIPNLIESDVD